MKRGIYSSVLELVGNTPIVRLKGLSEETGAEVLAKLEYFNPMSSVKDRPALAMVEDAEKKGLLKKGSVIVEPTSGNTGVGLSLACAVKGYGLILVMPDTMSVERRKLLKAMGAQVVLTPGVEGMKGSIAKAMELVENNDSHIILQQFENPANPDVHVRTTAVEILEDCDRKLDIFIAGVGTGGTLTGVGKTLKKELGNVKVIAVEPDDSAVLSGDPPGPHKFQGIGAGFVSKITEVDIIDEIVRVVDTESFAEARRIAKEEGIFCGITSGAVLSAARKIASRPENKGKRILVIIPDTGERYLSTELFNELS